MGRSSRWARSLKTLRQTLVFGIATLITVPFSPLILLQAGKIYASSTDVVYPTNYVSVVTTPTNISPTKNIPGLFDGNTSSFALINYVNQPVSVTMEFDEPKTLMGFSAWVGGGGGARADLWKVEAADNQTDLAAQTGSYIKLADQYPTDANMYVNILFGQSYTYKVYKVTTIRNNGDGYVHWAELKPLIPFTLAANSITKKVLALSFDPTLSNGQTLSQYKNYGDPTAQDRQVSYWFNSNLGNRINFQIVQEQIVNGYVQKTDGFSYNETSYLNCLANTSTCHNPNALDYNWVINTYDLCGKLNRGEIDEVWMSGAPYDGFNESALAGPNAYAYNGPALTNNTCSKLMPIMGFNYERGINEMIHDFGHRTEATMTQLYGTWQENRTLTNWDKFGLVKAQSPNYNYSGCGSTHWAPNSLADYDYLNATNFADSNCADFANYPNLGDPQLTKQNINCSAWGCTENGYYKYFFSHIPKADGTNTDGTLNDWWQYIMNPNKALYWEALPSRTNIALNKPVVATVGMQGTPTAINDGVKLPEGGIWNTTQSTLMSGLSSYLTIDLQSVYDITTLRLQGNHNNNYKVQISLDNLSWTDLGTATSNNGTGERTRQLNVSGTGRYLKITEVAGVGPFSVSEVEAYTDNVAPTTSITAPINNDVLGGNVSIAASANDNFSVARVEFYVDGNLLSTDNSAPYTATWDTTNLVQGSSHSLSTKAYDLDGNSATSASINVVVLDSTAPTTAITAPTDSSTVIGVVNVTADASDNIGVSKVEFYADGNLLSTDTSAPYAATWDTSGLTNNTSHILTSKAYDAAGNVTTSADVNVLVSDLVLPTTSITSPANNATVTGNVTITATASDNIGVAQVEFYIDNNLAGTSASAPYTYVWDTSALVQGSSHTIFSKAYDAAGNSISSSVVTVQITDITAPTTAITAPTNNAVVTGSVNITANASDNIGVTKVEFYVDGGLLSTSTNSPYSASWNTSSLTQGSTHALTTKSYDAAGNVTTSASVSVQIADTTAPTTSVTAPANSASVTGTVTITANASDNVGVARVEFYVDGGLLSTDTTSPYSASWNTTGLTINSSHVLITKAYDAAGNMTVSTNVTVTIADITAPTVSITAPANNSQVQHGGNVTITANAADNIGVSKVEFYVSGVLKCTDTTSPYSCMWAVPSANHVAYTLTAKAYDAAGNVTTSTTITVTSK